MKRERVFRLSQFWIWFGLAEEYDLLARCDCLAGLDSQNRVHRGLVGVPDGLSEFRHLARGVRAAVDSAGLIVDCVKVCHCSGLLTCDESIIHDDSLSVNKEKLDFLIKEREPFGSPCSDFVLAVEALAYHVAGAIEALVLTIDWSLNSTSGAQWVVTIYARLAKLFMSIGQRIVVVGAERVVCNQGVDSPVDAILTFSIAVDVGLVCDAASVDAFLNRGVGHFVRLLVRCAYSIHRRRSVGLRKS